MKRYTTGQAREVRNSSYTWWGTIGGSAQRGSRCDKMRGQVTRGLAEASKRNPQYF